MGVANSDAKLYDEELQMLVKEYPKQVSQINSCIITVGARFAHRFAPCLHAWMSWKVKANSVVCHAMPDQCVWSPHPAVRLLSRISW